MKEDIECKTFPKSNYPHDSLNTPPRGDSTTGTISFLFSEAYHKGQI